MNDNTLLWLWLKTALNDRCTKIHKTFKAFGNIIDIYNADTEEYSKLSFLDEEDIKALTSKDLGAATYNLHLCETNHIGIVTIDDEIYPSLLREIDNPPYVLFYFGNYTNALSKPCITVVGSRTTTAYGEAMTSAISIALSKGGFTVVSGIASGIDTTAINSAVKSNGSVIAVLPCGLMAAKYKTKFLFKNIQYNGIAISEYLPKSPSHKFCYQERNRILSGLSAGTIVTQAPAISGALMTATYALDQGRDVFALMSNIDCEQSAGSNKLIKDGAYPITAFSDVFEFYKDTFGNIRYPSEHFDFSKFYRTGYEIDTHKKVAEFKEDMHSLLSSNEIQIINLLDQTETDWHTLQIRTTMLVDELNITLSELEAKGIIKACPGNRYKIAIE